MSQIFPAWLPPISKNVEVSTRESYHVDVEMSTFSLLHVNCIFRNTVSKSGRAAEFTLGKQYLRLYKLDEQGDFRHRKSPCCLLGRGSP